MEFVKQNGLEVIVALRIQPAARREEIVGLYNGERLKIALRAQPREGKANAALIAFLSKIARLPKSHISIVQGEMTKEKKVKLTFPEAAQKEAFMDLLHQVEQ